MSKDDNNEVVAIAEFVSRYSTDLAKAPTRETFKAMVKLAERKMDQAPILERTKSEGDRRLLNVIIWSLAITVSLAIVVNAYNHKQSLNIEKDKITAQSKK